MEILLESIKCKICFSKLEKPVSLPCGYVICEKHQHEGDIKAIYCIVCDLDHEIPSNGGFPKNLFLEKLIEKNIDCIDLGDEYNAAIRKIKQFSDLLERMEKYKSDPEEIIRNKITEMKAEIDLKREELKNQIDEEALEFIKKLDEYEIECKENLASIKAEIENDEKLNEWKEDLNQWREQMNNFKRDITLWKKIFDEANSKYDQMKTAHLSLYTKIFMERLNDYLNLKVLIGNDRDMIRNHSITYVVKNVKKYLNNEEKVNFNSERFRAFGIDWSVLVQILTNEVSGKKSQTVGISLCSFGNYTKETYEAGFDLVILHRTDPNGSIKHCINEASCDKKAYGRFRMIQLKELMNNDGLYDAENDCFTVQVVINSIKFKSIE